MDTQWIAPVHKSAVEQINEALRLWNETGVFVARDLWFQCLERARAARPGKPGVDIYPLARGFFDKEARNSVPENVLRRIVREAARQTKRSVLFSETFTLPSNRSGRLLTIKRLKTHELFQTHLHLAAMEASNRWIQEDGVWVYTDRTNNYFRFNGEEALQVFEHFLNECRTNPVWREALRIPEHIRPSEANIHAPTNLQNRAEDRRAA